jgi:hypothetical protein
MKKEQNIKAKAEPEWDGERKAIPWEDQFDGMA